MSASNHKVAPNAAIVLGKATARAAERLGLSRDALGRVIGRDRSSLSRSGIDPDSKPGELAALLIRCFRSLAVLVGENETQMRHWMQTPNDHTGGIPAEQVQTVNGLVTVCEYLDAIRAKV